MRLLWDVPGERVFETGVDRGVIYDDTGGHAWRGLVSVKETSASEDTTPHYIDGVKFDDSQLYSSFGATIEAYGYPEAVQLVDGWGTNGKGLFFSSQRRKRIGFSYRTLVANEIDGTDYGYKIHIVYNATLTQQENPYKSVGRSKDATLLSWTLSSIPKAMPGAIPTAHITIDSTKAQPHSLRYVEDILYGTDSKDPQLPDPAEMINMFNNWMEVIDNRDGTWTAIGPDSWFVSTTTEDFVLDWPNTTYPTADTYTIESVRD